MKSSDFSGNGKLIIEQLLAIHGPAIAFRLYGVMEYARQYSNLQLRDPKLLWQDTELLKQAGLYPTKLKPSQLTEWSKFLFDVNLKAALAITKIIPIKNLVGEVSDQELAFAREVLRNYNGLDSLFGDVEQTHPAWTTIPK